MSTEAVNHPSYYGGIDNLYEAIKVIEAWGLGFCLGNTVKYISRAGHKDPEKIIEDLEKSLWYLQRRIDHLKISKDLPDLEVQHECPIHLFFELSYAQYLTIPRSILQAMDPEWKERMAKCLNELDETFNWRPSEGKYWVQLKNDLGMYVKDPLMEYRHPDTKYIESLKNDEFDGDEKKML